MRSPSSAPPVRWEEGSTAMTPTVAPACPPAADQPVDERGLAHAGRPGEAQRPSPGRKPGVIEQGGDGVRFAVVSTRVFGGGQRLGHGPLAALPQGFQRQDRQSAPPAGAGPAFGGAGKN